MAQVIDPFGKDLVKKKKRIAPVIPTVTNKPPVTKAMDITPPVVTPFMSGNESAKLRDPNLPFSVENPGTFEQGVAERAKNAETKVTLKDEGLTGSEVGSAVQPNTVDDLAARQKALQRQRMQESLQGLVGSAERSAGVETGKLTNEFRGAEGRLRTQDTMNRAGTEKFLNIGNLGQSGQVGQSSTAQNVITQGARSQQTAQEQELKAGVQQRLAEVKAQAAQDLANFDFDVEIQELESQMRTAEAQQEYEREQEVLRESREYDDYLRQVEKADDVELLQIKGLIADEKAILDAEIDEARAINDFSRDKEFAERQAVIDLQLEGARQSGRETLENQRQTGASELESQRQEGRETLASDKDVAEDNDEPKFSNSVINSSLKNALETSKQKFEQANENIIRDNPLAETSEFTNIEQQNAVENFLRDNMDDISIPQARNIMKTYQIDEEEFLGSFGGA